MIIPTTLRAAPQPESVIVASRFEGGLHRSAGDTDSRSLRLPYEVIDGLAVHARDMVLGTIEEVLSEASARSSAKLGSGLGFRRRDLSAVEEGRLWPGGIVPYVIDEDIPDRHELLGAIDEWNTRTVIRLVPRNGEDDYVRVRVYDGALCRAHVGRIGGEQHIFVPKRGCGWTTYLHEIGHAVGLWHEHQREDRDDHLMLLGERPDPFMECLLFPAVHPATGPYDWRSVMHYSLQPGEETIPPGLSVRRKGLSPGDIDGVARMYGMRPAGTTVSTNPANLEIIVDGVRLTAPQTFDWQPGSRHVVEVPEMQEEFGRRYLFGRWNLGEGGRRLELTADPARTWIEASFILQQQVSACSSPSNAGRVQIVPESADGYYTQRAPITLSVAESPDSSLRFFSWSGGLRSRPAFERYPLRVPAQTVFLPPVAQFTGHAVFEIDSGSESHRFYLDGWNFSTPVRITASRLPITIRAPEVQEGEYPTIGRRRPEHRYRFENWSDGGAIEHVVTDPPEGGRLTLNTTPEYLLNAAIVSPSESVENPARIQVRPESSDGYYPAGEQVELTAVPGSGREFVAWVGDAYGTSPNLSIRIDGHRRVGAVFSNTQELRSGEPVRVSQSGDLSPKGYRVRVPPGSSELTVRFQTSRPQAEASVLVWRSKLLSRRDPVWEWFAHPDEEYQQPGAEQAGSSAPSRSGTLGRSRAVTVDAASDPPLQDGFYFIRLDVPEGVVVTGSLQAEVLGNGVPPSPVARPRAFTFVASPTTSPASQSFELTNKGDSSLRFEIDSTQSWLAADPMMGTLSPGQTQEVAVKASTAGLLPATHRGRLTVVSSDPQSPESGKSRKFHMPVTFAVVTTGSNQDENDPATPNSHEITLRRANGSADIEISRARNFVNATNLIAIDRVRNSSTTRATEPLFARLFATTASTLHNAQGFVIAETSLAEVIGGDGGLAPNSQFDDVRLRIRPSHRIHSLPTGSYDLHLTFSEAPDLDSILHSVKLRDRLTVCD